MNTTQDTTAARMTPRGKPDTATMVGDIRDALREARNCGLFDRLRDAHRTRRCWWESQQADGKVAMQADKAWVPWKGAIDSRVPLAHQVVSELTMLQMTVFGRGDVAIQPRQTMEDMDKAGVWTLVFNYYLENQMPGALLTVKESLRKQLRLLFDAKNELGYALSRLRWRKRQAKVSRDLKPEQVTAVMAREALAGLEARFPEEEELPEGVMEQVLAEVQKNLQELMQDPAAKDELAALLLRVDPAMTEAEADKAARQLRTEGSATYYVVADAGGVPEVKALVPWLNCGHTLDLTDDGNGTAFFEREIYTLQTLEARAKEEGWDAKFLAEVIEHPGESVFDADGTWNEDGGWVMNGTSFLMEMKAGTAGERDWFEILRRTGRAVGPDGLETIYETVLHGSIEDMAGRHVCLSHETHEMMFVTHALEPTVNAWLSRGVPEIVLTMQAALKKLYDAETCRAEITSVPPLQVDSENVNVRPMPGIVLASRRTNNQFLGGPAADNGAHRLRQELRAWVDDLFYRGQNVDPELKRAFREDLAAEAMVTISQIYRGMWKLIQRHTDPVRASRVAGQPVNLSVDRMDLQGDADVTIAFNIGVLSEEMASKFLDFGTKVMTADRSGAMDAFEFVRTAWQMFDPSAARRLVQTREATTGAEIKEVKAVISALAAGQYDGTEVPDNINWQIWEERLQAWMANPETQQMMAERPMLRETAREVWDAVQFQKEQKTTNVQWGRTGQAPVPPWMQDRMTAEG